MLPDIDILRETAHWIAVNKPAGIPTIPDNPTKKNDVLGMVKQHTQQKLFVVHRLDKFVTGVLVFAKTIEAYRHLRQQFSDRTLLKTYKALVDGNLQVETMLIDKPLRRFCSGRVGVDEKNGEVATTKVVTQARFGGYTLVRIHPRTGRRHQIRAHLACISHPIAGDRRYGDKRMSVLFPTILLHAESLEFKDMDGTNICLEAPLAKTFVAILRNLEKLQKLGFDWSAQCPLTLLN